MGMQRWLFILGLSLLVILGAGWGLALVWINSVSWKLALSLPVGLVVFWPIANHLSMSPLRPAKAKSECVIEFTLEFLATVVTVISGVTGAVALLGAAVLAVAGQGAIAGITAMFGVRAFAMALGCLILAVAVNFIFRFLVKKVGAVEIDILYLTWAGAAVLAIAYVLVNHSWIAVLDETQVPHRTKIAAIVAGSGIAYSSIQILAATPREKKVVTPDAVTTALILIFVAVLFWAMGKAFVPFAIGLLAWVGAWVLDREKNRRKF